MPAELGVRRRTAVRSDRWPPMDLLFFRRLPLWKRALDVVVSSVALLVLASPLAAVAAADQTRLAGPVFFTQRRSGLGGKPFVLYKFRSMVVDAEARKRNCCR